MADNNTNCLIIDSGSALTKIGISGEDAPKLVVPTIYGYEINSDLNQNGTNIKYFESESKLENISNYHIFNLIEDNTV